MEQRILGRTGLSVTAVALGGARLGEVPGQEIETVRRALDLGVNFIDTARAYGNSEEFIGKAIAGIPKTFAIATKSLPVSRDQTLRDLETSLLNLGLEKVDLLYVHSCETEERVEATLKPGGVLDACRDAQKQGLTDFIGVSFNHLISVGLLERIARLIKTDEFDVIQVPLNLVRTELVDSEVIPLAISRNLGVVVNYPTVDGLLAKEWGVFRPIFERYARTPGQAALLYLLAHEGVHTVLSGMSTPQVASENVEAGEGIARLSHEERRRVIDDVAALGLGPCRSCGICHPYTHGIPVARIMMFYDMAERFGIAGAKEQYRAYRESVLACDDLSEADRVCPQRFDVLKMLREVHT
ncbi:MAG: aldo/keto reductase [Candidatus Latescibacteria bacterium]|nr:aldo/keto reductase [Candidatus Latescibacterota bacterium]